MVDKFRICHSTPVQRARGELLQHTQCCYVNADLLPLDNQEALERPDYTMRVWRD